MQALLHFVARCLGAMVMLLLSVAHGMADMSFTTIAVPEARFAYRAVFLTSDQLVIGSLDQDTARISLHLLQDGEAGPLDVIDLSLSARADFDLVPAQGGLLAAVERHGGASSVVNLMLISGTGSAPALPPAKIQSDERRPRFVRGGIPATVVGDTGPRAVLLEAGSSPKRSVLCDSCANAIALSTASGLAIVAKTEKSGPPMADVRGGTLDLIWPLGDAEPRQLLGGETVFDYDVALDGDSLLLTAVTDGSIRVVRLSDDGVATEVASYEFDEYWEPFSPTLSIEPEARSLAVLVSVSSINDGTNQIWITELP